MVCPVFPLKNLQSYITTTFLKNFVSASIYFDRTIIPWFSCEYAKKQFAIFSFNCLLYGAVSAELSWASFSIAVVLVVRVGLQTKPSEMI